MGQIRWLHLSDLHAGCRGEAAWWDAQNLFEPHVREVVREIGPPHLVLFTGDLANSGKKTEYDLVDAFLDRLCGWIAAAAPSGSPPPLLLAVPGNHDVRRPQGLALLPYRVCDKLDEGRANPDVAGLEDALFRGKPAERRKRARQFLDPLLGEYRKWFERRVLPQFQDHPGGAKLHVSHFPCDFAAELTVDGVRLGVVGLNSAWAHYDAGDFTGRIWLKTEQLHAALPPAGKGASPLAALERFDRRLLLFHHPPAWLSKRARRSFDDEVAPPGRFDLCLFGHLHEGRADSRSFNGGLPCYYFQAESAFGLEEWGSPHEERRAGCVWGSLSASGVIHVRPVHRVKQGGAYRLVDDIAFAGGKHGTQIAPYVLKSEGPPPPLAAGAAAGEPPPDFTSYVQATASETAWIRISGLGSGAGRAKAAQRYEIQKLYTPLRVRGWQEWGEIGNVGAGEDAAPQAPVLRPGSPALKDVLPLAPRLHIEGRPGAGKTTFLRLIANCLARDLQGQPGPEGAAWSEHYLGLRRTASGGSAGGPGGGSASLLPVFLKAAQVAPLLAGGRRADRSVLLDHLDALRPKPEDGSPWPARDAFRKRLEDGTAYLLLDGIDEVGDDAQREQVLDVLRDAAEHWRCPIVVSSRPIPAEALKEMGFEQVAIDDFGAVEVGRFLESWVRALYEVDAGGRLEKEGRDYAEALRQAIAGSPGIRSIATNPVMLTCLSVVHWNEGRLPEGRSRVYCAVIRWLIAARTEQRQAKGYSDRQALLGLASLALHMLEASPRQVEVPLQEAARVTAPLFPGDHPEKSARDWLRFEGELSGIVEEVAGGKLRFWHLTFQEYLAAHQLALLPGEEWWPRLKDRLDERAWRECVDLFPGCLFDEGKESRVRPLLENVLCEADCGPQAELAQVARAVGLAGRFLASLEALEYQKDAGLEALYKLARERATAIFEVEGAAAVPEEQRIAAADALGLAGDERFGRPDDLEGGLFPLVSLPGKPPFRLGKYPVTVAEFERFVEDGGYEEEELWSDDDRVAWRVRQANNWRQPDEWDEQLLHPTRPVVYVSWYEARAYCRWLTRRMRLRERELEARLPWEEDEWAAAATHCERGGPYPWGPEEPTSLRANFGKGTSAHPTPVGIYPAGVGEHGHLDLAGNVWEWCEDPLPWEEVWVGLAAEPREGQTSRPLRGGSFWVVADLLRVDARIRVPASNRNVSVGFRVCVAPASR
jgi:formylglycine-generating enzyme required for sulfatase activity/3',5'-cyclic AMP phosphodiesterase CpdA